MKTHLAELARHYHAAAQKSKNSADYQEAVRWYREYLESFPTDPEAAQTNFLLAELLFEDKHFAEASDEYEKTAYGYPTHAKSADAGYAALLSYAQLKDKVASTELSGLQQISITSALRFAQTFTSDPRAAPVLADTAEKLYALKDNARAEAVAQKVIDLQPAAADEQRRIAWTVLAYTTFERGAFDRSEQAFADVLKLTPPTAKNRNELIERQAAAIYKQGELARDAGKLREAVAHFERVGITAPQSTIRATAQFDAAAALIALKDWDNAARTLEDFRQRFPNNTLQADVGNKLAFVYLENGQWANAAAEFERLASSKDPKTSREALWQAAELYEKANSHAAAARIYERYIAQNPQPLEPAIEARFRLAKMAKENSNPTRELALMKEIFEADQSGGAGRTARTHTLGAAAALALAEPVANAYRKIALIEPLKKQLKLKKEKMEETLKAYTVAANYGVAEVTTAATYHIATVYRDFSKALMTSERPKKLNKLEREQYDVLLEEQAFPFEEKAIAIHQVNAQRTTSGIYDKWVKSSFDALRELQPARYGKTERAEGVIDAIR
ncbi:MAG: tetratricopeptide repeat protein [Burkholderiaceae bacterium]